MNIPDFSNIFESAKTWVQVTFGISSLGAFIGFIVYLFKYYILIKKGLKTDKTMEAKDKEIKVLKEGQKSFEDSVLKEVHNMSKAVQIYGNMMTSAFLDSNVSVHTKQFLAEKANELKEIDVVVDKAVEVTKQVFEDTKESAFIIKEQINATAQKAVDSVNEVKVDLQNVYNKLTNKE